MVAFPITISALFEKWRNKKIANKLVNMLIDGSMVLNIGCGKGYLEAELVNHYPNLQILGIDQIIPMQYKGQFIAGDFATLSFDNQQFDIAILSLSLHHFINPSYILKKTYNLLKPGGILFIVEIAPKSNFLKQMLFDSGLLCVHRKSTWTRDQLQKIIESAGFKVTKEESTVLCGGIFYASK